MAANYVLGIDYGTDSCRVLLVDTSNGQTLSSATTYYPRWNKGLYCDPENKQFRQHPLDYIESLEEAVKDTLNQAPADAAKKVIGMAFAMTSSTLALTDTEGTPLALTPDFHDDPNAMFVLWKDHTAIEEADDINHQLKQEVTDYSKYSGGRYSSEWVWSKVLHLLRKDTKIRSKAHAWVEHCDWLPNLLCGYNAPGERKYSRCAAGHKALWHEDWGGLPPKSFFKNIDPLFEDFQTHIYINTFTSNTSIGSLSAEWAKRLGLTTNVTVAVGSIDCHVGAVGAHIQPGTMVSVIGTSTCDIMVAEKKHFTDHIVPGICGQVDGSVLPGLIGFEAGQPAFGDLYAWFKNILLWPMQKGLDKIEWMDQKSKNRLLNEMNDNIIPLLTTSAEKISAGSSAVLATDWINGRRSPDSNESLKATITGLEIGSKAPHIFRALVEATAYGLNTIRERFSEHGLNTREIIATGGIAQKSPFIMQVLANVTGLPIRVASTSQAVALGSAMFAAVAAGVYKTVEEAQNKMGQGYTKLYQPCKDQHQIYQRQYNDYRTLGILLQTSQQ